MTLRVNVYKPLFSLSRFDLSRSWQGKTGPAGAEEYLTLGHDTSGLEVKAARVVPNVDGEINGSWGIGFLVDKRRGTEGSDGRSVLDKRCALIFSDGKIDFKYSAIGVTGEICGTVDKLTGDVGDCYRALVTRGAKIELPDDEVSPFLAEIEDSMRLFNSHLSG